MKLFTSSGILHYSEENSSHRVIVEADPAIREYYRSLLPKYWKIFPSRYPPHLTVIRIYKEKITKLEAWKKYQGQRVEFLYEPGVHQGKTYYWLRAVSKPLEDLRKELGLVTMRRDPTGAVPASPEYSGYFHITIGNKKSRSE